MAKQLKIQATLREQIGGRASRKLGRAGIVPANVYGKDHPNLNLELSKREISNLLAHATSEHVLVDLEIKDGAATTSRLALIQEVQHHPLRRDVMHVDFHAVKADEMLHAAVPIVPVGEPEGVKNSGGVMEVSVHELEVTCLPKDLPDVIRVDVSALGLNQSIHVRDLVLPEGVAAHASPDLTVISVAAPRVEVEPVAAAAAPTEPEVLKEKKEDPKA
ncbi:MAG: 50S ribosomal protein L25, partial [Chthoniobacteraceae bacterium]